jgi:hypothetical protein
MRHNGYMTFTKFGFGAAGSASRRKPAARSDRGPSASSTSSHRGAGPAIAAASARPPDRDHFFEQIA